jgi:putative nucleotidyltransferase with HDIG domain
MLFVDDEPAITELFQCMFKRMSDAWEVHCAQSGLEALALMDKLSFAVVVSDMRMPGMNGAQLLTEVMQRYPRTARLILSGYAEQEAVAKCVGAAHQYLMKPCDLATLSTVLKRVCALDVFLKNEHLKSLVAKMDMVPSLPSLYFRVLEELQSPTSSIDRIGELVAMDPGMSAKLLQLVNSAFFGVRREISNPTDAVQLLGVGTVRSLALTIHAFSCFDQAKLREFSFERLWNHCLMTGLFSRKIAEDEVRERTLVDEALIAGLLHDIGKLMLVANLTQEYRTVVAMAHDKHISELEAELAVFGATHADVGAYLLGLWGLPVPIVEAVALHHHPARNINRQFCPLTAVHVANVIEHQNAGTESPGPAMVVDEPYLEWIGINDRLPAWRNTIQEMVQQGLSTAA